MQESEIVDPSGNPFESHPPDNATEALDRTIRELVRHLHATRPGLFSKLMLLGVCLASTVYVLTKLGDVAHSFAEVRETWQPKPGPLDVWTTGAKDTFSRELLTIGFTRWRRTNVYIATVTGGWSRTEIDKAFERYTDAVEEWDSRYMVNVLGLRRYYGRAPEESFQRIIQAWYRSSNDCVLALRMVETGRKGSNTTCSEVDDAQSRDDILERLGDIQYQIFWHFYHFSRTLDPKPAKESQSYLRPEDVSKLIDR
jgi:hypothetical protein